MAAHATLSPSSSERWLNCPGGLIPSLEFPRESSVYAEEGTRAHAWLEKKFNGENISEVMLEDAEMYNYVMAAYEYVVSTLEGVLPTSEGRVKIFSTKGADCFGTVDAYGVVEKTLHIFDFKYGKGVKVPAKDNTQLMLYAFGVLKNIVGLNNIDEVAMHIIQPRIANTAFFFMTKNDLVDWITGYAIPLGTLAATGQGAVTAGSWCKFCPLKGRCKATSFINELENSYKSLPEYEELSMSDKVQVISKRKALTKWMNDVEASLTEDLASERLADDRVKLVEVTRPIRIVNERKAIEVLTNAGFNHVTSTKVLPYGQLKAHEELLRSNGCLEQPKVKVVKIAYENDSELEEE